jgi:lactobin A/cerein 7B family class IIb bacteriocin
MREMTFEELQQIEGGGWRDVLKGMACAGGVVAAFYIGGPLGVRLAVRTGAVAACILWATS